MTKHLLLLTSLCLWLATPALAQSGVVAGRVTDTSGLPLPGINVYLVGTTRGAATDVEGYYRIDQLPSGPATLTASGVGYRPSTKEVVLGGPPLTVDFVLEEDVVLTGEVVVTASRRPQAVLDVPASVAVLSPRELESRNIVSLDDALRYIPGVQVQENQVNVRGSSGFAYNTGSRVLLLLDGMPLLTPDTDGMPFDALPIAQIERIEVLKGPGSALYGGGALGGVVNVITRDIPEQPETSAMVFAGAHFPVRYQVWKDAYPEGGQFRVMRGFSASHARRFSPTLGGWVNLAMRQDPGYLNYNRAAFAQGFAKLYWTPSPSVRAELLSGILFRERDNFLFWNGARDALNPGSLAIGSQDPAGAPTGTNDVSSNQISLLPQFTHLLSPKLFYAVRGRLFASLIRPLDENGKVKSFQDGTVGVRYGGEAQLDYAPQDGRQLTLGVSGDALATRSTFFVTADGDSTGGQPETAVFGQWEETRGATTLSGGLRLDRYAIDTGTTLQRLSPKLAVSTRLALGTSLRLAYGHGFRAPSLAERFTDNQDFFPIVRNLGLLPERNISLEVGVRDERRLAGSVSLETDAAIFLSDYFDLIEPRLVPELGAFQFVNLTRARIAGAEISVEAARPHGRLQLGYTFLDAQDRTLGEPLASRSRHQLTVGIDHDIGPFLNFGADWRMMSAPERVDSDFALFVQDADVLVGMRVLDLRAIVTLGSVRATLLLNNALDYYYLERPAFLAPPRHAQMRVQWDF